MGIDYRPAYVIDMDVEDAEFRTLLEELQDAGAIKGLEFWGESFSSEFELGKDIWKTTLRDNVLGEGPVCFANFDVRGADPEPLLSVLKDAGYGDKIMYHGVDTIVD